MTRHADGAVDDGIDRPLVEERFHERERRAHDRETPEDERPVEVDRLAQLQLERQFATDQDGFLLAKQWGRVGTGALVEQQLEHELGPQVADVFDRRLAPLPERDRPVRVAASVVRVGPSALAVGPLSSTRPASRSWPSAR